MKFYFPNLDVQRLLGDRNVGSANSVGRLPLLLSVVWCRESVCTSVHSHRLWRSSVFLQWYVSHPNFSQLGPKGRVERWIRDNGSVRRGKETRSQRSRYFPLWVLTKFLISDLYSEIISRTHSWNWEQLVVVSGFSRKRDGDIRRDTRSSFHSGQVHEPLGVRPSFSRSRIFCSPCSSLLVWVRDFSYRLPETGNLQYQVPPSVSWS